MILKIDCQIKHFLNLIKTDVWHNNFMSLQGINNREDIKQKNKEKQQPQM